MEGAAMEDAELRNGWISCHLRRRCQQRGVRKAELEAELDWADGEVPVGGGRVAKTLTRGAAR
jgi:hypothetical protein